MANKHASTQNPNSNILIIFIAFSTIFLLPLFIVKFSRSRKAGDDRNTNLIQGQSRDFKGRLLSNKIQEQKSSNKKVDLRPHQKKNSKRKNSGNIRNQLKYFDTYLKLGENGHCPVNMVYIEGGEFERKYIVSDALECRRKVIISKGYCLDKYEVTQENYKDIMRGDNPSSFKKCGLNCPVSGASWYEAQRFCNMVKKRLPTAAEWEYAALQGDKQKYFIWINDGMVEVRWKSTNKSGNKPFRKMPRMPDPSCAKKLCPVGASKLPDLDLYDMYGNFWEYTIDSEAFAYIEDTNSCFWEETTVLAPLRDPGKKDADGNVIMGGSWESWKYSDDDNDEMEIRGAINPYLKFWDVGFRCAKDAK